MLHGRICLAECGCPSCTLHASSIPKGLCPPAQGCEERATLGNGPCAPQLRRSCAINRNNAMPQSLRMGLLIRGVGKAAMELGHTGMVCVCGLLACLNGQ